MKSSTEVIARRRLNNPKVEDKTPTSSFGKKAMIVAFIVSCMGLVTAISQLFLIHKSIRLDESQSLWQTSHSLMGTLKVVASDVHVPLYHLTLHYWQLLAGQDIESARLLSFVFFFLTIPVVYLLSRKILSVNWSLFTVFLFSFSPFMNWYANEARMYTLLALIATISSFYFMSLIESKGKKGWIGYSLSAIVGVYSHYFFAFTLLAQGIFFLLNRKSFVKGTLKKFIFLAIVLFIELLPWFWYFRSLGSASNTSPDLPLPSTVDFFNVFSQFSFGFQNDSINTVLVSGWPILVVVSLLAVKYGQRVSTKTAYILMAAFGPVLLAFGVSYVVTPFFLSRYMTACLVPLTVIVVWFVSHYSKKLSLSIAVILVGLVVIFSFHQYISPTTPVEENYKGAAHYFESNAKSQDIIVLSAPFTVYPVEYYYQGTTTIRTLPLWDRSIPGPIPSLSDSKLEEQVKSLNKGHKYVYLLLSYDQGYEDKIRRYYDMHFEKVTVKQFSPDLHVYVYRVGYDEVKPISQL